MKPLLFYIGFWPCVGIGELSMLLVALSCVVMHTIEHNIRKEIYNSN